MRVCVCVRARVEMTRPELVHVDGVEDPLGELLELSGGRLRLLLESLVVVPQPLDLTLKSHLVFTLLCKVGRG